MIIFREKTDKAIRNLNIPPGVIWVEEIWLKHTQAERKRLGFQNSMLSFNAFAAHLTDGVKNQLLEGNSVI